MKNKTDPTIHIGETYGIFTITGVDGVDNHGNRLYQLTCNICGYTKTATYAFATAPNKVVTHCKHIRPDGSPVIYGYRWKDHRLQSIFKGMIKRCCDPNNKDYKWYGEKGIDVCDEWKSNPSMFEEWALSSGYCDDLTLDRLDVNMDYGPSNCQWIPLEENSRKAGRVNWITVDDITLTGRQWSGKLGLGQNRINTYIRKYGLEPTKNLISLMLIDPPQTKTIDRNQTWFSVYGIKV